MRNFLFFEKNLAYFFHSILFLICISAYADVITVPPGGDIQAAINEIDEGGTINLEPGTYPLTQQLIINKPLTINGSDNTFIQSPTTSNLTETIVYLGSPSRVFTPIIIVKNTSDVILQKFHLDGRSQGDPEISNFTGIGFHNSSGALFDLIIFDILENQPNFYEGCGVVLANNSGTHHVVIQNCFIDYFQKEGIIVIGGNLAAQIIGGGVVNRKAQSTGIKLIDVTGVVISNTLMASYSLGQTIGIIADRSNHLTIERTSVRSYHNGIYLQNCNDLKLVGNSIYNNILNIIFDEEYVNKVNNSYLTENVIYNTIAQSEPTYGIFFKGSLYPNVNPQSFFNGNVFHGSTYGLVVVGNNDGTAGPMIKMHNDTFSGSSSTYYIQMVSCPNNIWPSTETVSFDGLIPGEMTYAQFNALVINPATQKIFDKHSDPALGLVLAFVQPLPPTIDSITPSSGDLEGGTTVKITGTHFNRDTQISFGSQFATQFNVISDTLIIATTPPGTGTVPVTVTTTNGTSPIVSTSYFSYIPQVLENPLPPTDFIGTIKKNKFVPKTAYQLIAKWKASPSADVVSYQIYKNLQLVKTIPADSPLIYKARLKPGKNLDYTVVAVSSIGKKSIPVNLKVSNK